MIYPLHDPDHPNDPAPVGGFDDDKDIIIATETLDVRSDPDMAPDINPGGLTFEEGQLSEKTWEENHLICVLDTAGGMGRHLGVFSCTMLKYMLAPPYHFFFPIFSRHDQCWLHHRHWYILHSIVYPRVSRLRWCISDALGPRICILALWGLYLARVWVNVSTFWRREGVP
jgi:hypothetical protein